MDRLQKKCFIVSAGFHLLLALVLFIGPAFLTPPHHSDDMPVIDFVPFKTVDAMISGGGNPNANSAPPAPKPPPPVAQPAPQPQPQPRVEPPKMKEPEPEPEPPKDTVKEPKVVKDDPDSLEINDHKPKREFTLKPTVRKPTTAKSKGPKQPSEAEKRAQEWADARQRASERIGEAVTAIGNGLSGGTSIELKGLGGGGLPYANFYQAVKSVYARAWVVPDGVSDDSATTTAVVTIARDGTVLSSRITRSSGNREVDRSVQAALDRVKYAAPLPDDAKEDQRTVPINFNVKAKKLLG